MFILRVDEVLILGCGVKKSAQAYRPPLSLGEREERPCDAQLDHAEDVGRSDAQPAAVVAVATSINSETQQAVAGMARKMAFEEVLDFVLGHEIRGRDVVYVGEDVAAAAAKNK